MKNKLLAVLATFGMVASASAVKINNNLSINGFIDGSYYSEDNQANNSDSSNVGLDEVELNFLVNAGNISGELHIDSEDDTNDTGLDIEQVHFTYSFGNGASVQVGRFGSALGFEREDPAGLYTYSRAYGPDTGFDLGNVDEDVMVGEGARLSYGTGDFSGSLALFNGIAEIEDNNGTKNDLDYELALSYTGIDNLVLGAGFITKRPSGDANNTEVWTVNAAYTLDKLLIAGEYTNAEQGANDVSAYMILADYDVNDKLGVAVRYSNWETSANGDESDKLTFAPNYAITDNLGAIVEFSAEEDADGNEIDSFAVELTYTF